MGNDARHTPFDTTTPRNVWQEYERRKRELAAQDLTPEAYQFHLRALCDELGV